MAAPLVIRVAARINSQFTNNRSAEENQPSRDRKRAARCATSLKRQIDGRAGAELDGRNGNCFRRADFEDSFKVASQPG